MDLREKNKLLYARAGFGIPIRLYGRSMPVADTVVRLFPKSVPPEVAIITPEEWTDNSPKALKQMGDEMQRKEMRKAFRERTQDLNRQWMQDLVNSDYPLLEKTTLFWHGHFATRLDNPYFDQQLLNVLRQNALGNFGDLLKAVSKSPAMLQFLNNQQNKKQHPNENFAREVMELFTLGRGHYTEDDIKEAARAFTGWGYDDDGNFIDRPKQHDDGEKIFLGKKGNFTGDDILDIILTQKQTAIFITQKVYRYFVSDEHIDEQHVKALAADFYKSNYNISSLLKEIFTAEWFYKDDMPGSKIKSPIELLVGYQRLLPMMFDNDKTVINLQRILGQYLFNPPNVAGWPGGKNWIDSSSLVIRMRLPESLFGSKELDLSAKETDAEMTEGHRHAVTMDTQPAKAVKMGKVTIDWSNYLAFWRGYKRAELPAAIAAYLLPVKLPAERLKQVTTFADNDSEDEYIKSLTILLMELPEYQLT
jgi:uncharacterized protein (DUF1800 family)